MHRQTAIGIDIGGTGMRAVRLSRDGTILAEAREITDRQAPLPQLDRLIAAVDDGSPAAIGIGVPSRINSATAAIYVGGFVDLSGPPLARRLANPRKLPIVTENDGAMALIAEARLGAARGKSSAIMLTIGTGIGGGALLGGKVLRGRSSATEFGHITAQWDGLECVCGRRGCVETLSSGTGLRLHCRAAGLGDDVKIEDLLTRTNSVARSVIRNWIGPLRSAIDSLVAVLDPEIVVLGGGLGHAACTALAGFPSVSSWFQCPVVAATVGSDAGVIGAGLAAFDLIKEQ